MQNIAQHVNTADVLQLRLISALGLNSAMKCKYTFKINGYLKATGLKPITIRGWTFEFSANEGIVDGLSVIVPANNPEDLPSILQTPGSRSKATINVPSPSYLFIKRDVRAIEGALSLFGVDTIDLNAPLKEWLPENEEEKTKLELIDFKSDRGEVDVSKLPNVSFDIIARAVISADDIADIEPQLAFCRKGIVDRNEERYIEAIYDFYFFIESLFAQGKTKNPRVKEAFKQSNELRESIEEVLKNPQVIISPRHDELHSFMKQYGGMSVDDIIEHIVDLRGFLHHHTPKRKNAWHPEEHKRYESAANLLGAIAFSVAMRRVIGYLYRSEVINTYAEMFAGAQKVDLDRKTQP